MDNNHNNKWESEIDDLTFVCVYLALGACVSRSLRASSALFPAAVPWSGSPLEPFRYLIFGLLLRPTPFSSARATGGHVDLFSHFCKVFNRVFDVLAPNSHLQALEVDFRSFTTIFMSL
jgi:hypothetical protein